MMVAVVMPQLGLTMEEGTISAWLKKTGDFVKKSELLFSVSTDKTEMDVESEVEGILTEIIEEAERTVPVGTVVAYIEAPSGEDDASGSERQRPSELGEGSPVREDLGPLPQISRSENGGIPPERVVRSRQLMTPRAKRLAKEFGVDVAGLRAGSPGGEITEKDIRAVVASPKRSSSSVGVRRQLIAERLTRSVQMIPAFSVAAEVNAESLVALHESLKASPLSKASSVKLTMTDLLLSVFAQALKCTPELNATWEENGIRNRASVDIGLAVATAKGVVAPVIRNADAIELQDLAARRSELVENARLGRLSLVDLEGGVGTLSNLGMYRVDHFQAIINPGQSSILAVGQIRERPWVDKTLTVKRTLMLNLTVDHRVADGAVAAVFLGKVIELIEDPRDLSKRDGADRRSNG